MTSEQFNERFETEWEAPAHGTSDQQVGMYANGSSGPAQYGIFDGRQQSSLMQLAEQTVIEAHKLAERIKDQGVKDGEAEPERIASIVEEKAKRQTAMLLEVAQDEAAANANAVAVQAEQEAQRMVRKARREAHDIVMAAKQQADDFVSDARLEAEYMVRKLTARATDEIREGRRQYLE